MARAHVVLDTNVYIPALLWTGVPHRLLRLAEAGDVTLVTTPAIMEELREVLGRPKVQTQGQNSAEFSPSALPLPS